jgi:hypothetical protein
LRIISSSLLFAGGVDLTLDLLYISSVKRFLFIKSTLKTTGVSPQMKAFQPKAGIKEKEFQL